MKTISAIAKISHHSVLILSAFGEPPCSGLSRFAEASVAEAATATSEAKMPHPRARRRLMADARRKAARFYSEIGCDGLVTVALSDRRRRPGASGRTRSRL